MRIAARVERNGRNHTHAFLAKELGGGGGTSGGMEPRLAKLEAQMEHVQADLGKLANVPADLAGIKVQVGNLPTKDYLNEKFERQLRVTGAVVAIFGVIFTVASKLIG